MKTKSIPSIVSKIVCSSLIVITALTSSCAVFNARYNSWNKQVARDPDGILSFSRDKTLGQGQTAVLMIHGFGDGPHVWDRLSKTIADEGVTVRCMRLPGWGAPIETKQYITLSDWETAIQDELQALQQTHDKTVIMAHSLGGCLSTWMVQAGTIQPDALILYAPMFGVSNQRSPVVKTRTWFNLFKGILPDTMTLESLFPDHSLAGMARPRTERDPFVPVSVYKMLYVLMDARDDQTPQISCPLRLLLPEEDKVVDSEKAKAWFETAEAPAKTLDTIPNTGHVLPLDIDPNSESSDLFQWLSQQGITP